ncbi:exonuclease SbcCD subunit D [archaeon]|jgi:DNA repair protein SbcD/Mre11|nr:exonuclease SbcCD subunit D [archaeon]
MKFSHIADSHLGGWRQPELQELNRQSFTYAINTSIEEQVDFILFAGDLFDSAFPSIETLKFAFSEFKKLKDANIKSYIIAGSHDYSVSGKTFLDVLEKAGFCQICKYQENQETQEITLEPIRDKECYIYGYPGKKSGLEVESLRKIKINQPYSENFRILMLHTTVKEAAQNLPIDSIPLDQLPQADYYALGHIHIDFNQEVNNKPAVYGGPTFPNNFKELEELKQGAFYIIEVAGYTKVTKKEIKIKPVELIKIEIDNAIKATEKIIKELEKRELKDKIILLKLFGILKQGKYTDIKFQEIQDFIEKQNAYSFLKNTSKLEVERQDLQIEFSDPNHNKEKIEETLIKTYEKENPSNNNKLISPLMEALTLEKQEDEKSATFESRLLLGLGKVLDINFSEEI